MSSFDLGDPNEPYFAEDLGGLLVRYTKPTRKDYDTPYTIVIDGESIEVPRAREQRDGLGNVLLDAKGLTIPRYTTILDAMEAVLERQKQTKKERKEKEEEPDLVLSEPIPTLCHRDHLTPVGVCRVCSVRVETKGRALMMPACCTELRHYFKVAKDKVSVSVYTHNSTDFVDLSSGEGKESAGKYVKDGIIPLLRMLGANHLHDNQPQQGRYWNELRELWKQFGLEEAGAAGTKGIPRMFSREPDLEDFKEKGGAIDASSHAILVDHNNCILCSRCIRGCGDVRGFNIIGLAGKGSKTRIGFDLAQPMKDSGCVSCGECMISCPTGALTFAKTVYKEKPTDRVVKPEKVIEHSLFKGLPLNYLKWTEGAVTRVDCKKKDKPLCEQGKPGSSAFVLRKGSFDIRVRPGDEPKTESVDLTTMYGPVVDTRGPEDEIVGEMSLMNNDRRSATVLPATDDCEAWEISRDVLNMLLRDGRVRQRLDQRYCDRALQTLYAHSKEKPRETTLRSPGGDLHRSIFKHLPEEQLSLCQEFLKEKMRILRLNPGQVLIHENHKILSNPKNLVDKHFRDPDDGWFIIRSGYVEVTRATRGQGTVTLDLLGSGDHFGEIALLSKKSRLVTDNLPGGPSTEGLRTTTCRALDHVELVHVPGKDFLDMLDKFPKVLEAMELRALELMRKNVNTLRKGDSRFAEYVRLGLYQGQSLLVLDLDKCTRCQDCVKACADSHGGDTRLILDGPRFDRYLVPRSCRSCHDPLCLKECPVNAIKRSEKDGSLAIIIDDQRCIGCGLCANNCPYGSIYLLEPSPGISTAKLALNCDLCADNPEGPQCVRACPHEAASRWESEKLALDLGLYPFTPDRGAQAQGIPGGSQ